MAPANTVIATITNHHPAAGVAIANPAGAGRQRMKQSLLGLAAFAATLAVGLSAEAPARAAPIDSQGAVFTDAAFAPYFFGGRQYCWYDSAWSGPGWYWCGYEWRNGFGWGGPRGWHGWHDGGHGGDHHGGGVGHVGGGSHFAGGVGHMGGAGGSHFAGGVAHDGGSHFGGGVGHVGGAGGSPFGGGVGHIGGGGGVGHMGGGGGHVGGGGGHVGGGGGGGHH
nr:hypothetical protein [Phenylobacterium sp.]